MLKSELLIYFKGIKGTAGWLFLFVWIEYRYHGCEMSSLWREYSLIGLESQDANI